MYPLRSLNVALGVHVPQFGNPCSTGIEIRQNGLFRLLFDRKHTFNVSVVMIKDISNYVSMAEF